jgi:hypothetical protein
MVAALGWLSPAFSAAAEPVITIWHGDHQRIGHLGTAQDDFNLLGHVAA